jgi:hypothetical protein
LVSLLMLFLFLEVGGRPVAIYLLVNVLNIYADDVGDVGDADLAKTLLPTHRVPSTAWPTRLPSHKSRY